MVRWQSRRGDEFLYFNSQEFKSWESHSIWRRRTRTERNGNVCDVPARGTRIHGPKRRSAIQVHASDIVLRELRDAARSGRTVGEEVKKTDAAGSKISMVCRGKSSLLLWAKC